MFPIMEDPDIEESLNFDLEYTLHKENLSSGTEILPIEVCLEAYGNQSNFPLNIACLDHAPVLTQSTLIKSLILLVLASLSFLGNVATMLSIKKSKRHRSAHIYTLIYHLSIADLFVTFWCILGDAIWSLTVEWMAGNIECKIFKFFQMFSLYLSTFIMVLIGVDRFIAVKYPLKSMRNGLCTKLIAVCWICSTILSLPQMLIFHVKQGPFYEDFYQCVTYGFYTAEWQEHLYTVFTLVCGFLLPLFILVTTYILTVVTLHRNEEILDHTGTFRTLIDPNRRKLLRRAKMKSLRISVAIVCSFIVCWTPYYVMMITYLFFVPNKDQIINEDLYSGFFFFGMSNSFFNPLIYGIFHLWTPRRKELQRGSSSRRTLLTSLSFQRQRPSATLLNGSLVGRNEHVDAGCGPGLTMAEGNHSQPHHHHLHRNSTSESGCNSLKESVRTTNTNASFASRNGKASDSLVCKNSPKQTNLGNGNHLLVAQKEPLSDTLICICNHKGHTAPHTMEDHV